MRVFFFIFLNFFSWAFCAQNAKDNNAIIEYKIFNNTDNPNALYATLFINGPTTIYLEKFSTQIYNDAKKEAKRVNRITVDEEYLKIDHKKKEILSFEYLGANIVIVKDDYNDLKWAITGETKTIGEYQCTKATASYRGRDWVAWFTPEIALPYGPWKLHGLPGLIMEASEATGKYVWKVEKVEYKKDAIFDKDFSTLVETRNKKPLSKKQYFEDQNELEANAEAEFRRQVPGMGESVKVRAGYEPKYEWEK